MQKARAGILMLRLLLLWACCSCAFALDPSLAISQFAHTSWKSRDGVLKGYVGAIAQTPDGYLWLGTEFGIYRFDGVRAVPWQPPAGQQLPDTQINGLLVARDGALWIGTSKGLATWKDGNLKTYPELNGIDITALAEDREGTIWIGSRKLEGAVLAQLCSIRGDRLQCSGGDGTFGPLIPSLYEDSKGNLWVGVANGLWKWKPGVPEFFAASQSGNGIGGIAEDDEGAILAVNSPSILLRLVDGRLQPYPLTGSSRPNHPLRLLRDRDGGLWVGTFGSGLAHIYKGKVVTFSEGDGLSGNFITKLFEDREGNIWAGTINGLDRFREYAVPNVSVKQGLSNGVVASLLAANDRSIWIGTAGGLNVWKDGQASLVAASFGPAKPSDKVKSSPLASLLQESAGRIWIGTRSEFGYLEHGRYISIPDFPSGDVSDLVETSPGHLWVAAQYAGLLHVFNGKIVEKVPWTALGHKDNGYELALDPSRAGLWIGFVFGGVGYFSDGRIQKHYSVTEGLGSGRVNHLRFGPRGALWVSTESGLSRIKDDHITTLTSKNGLPCENVHWSVEDGDHNIWLKTPCGVLRISQSDMDAWVASPGTIVKATVFDVSDGVPSHRKSTGYAKPVVVDSDGKIWFVSMDGVGVIDPHHLAFNELPPPVQIEQITADDKTFSAANGLHLQPRVHYLAIDYTALSLVVPEKVRFRVKLEGQDQGWRELTNVRHVEYTNLPPKHYRFRVLACNNSGVWNEEGAALEFVIPPMWYQTNWFRAACVVAFLAMIWAAYQLRVRQLAAQFNMRLEERVHERTRIARDLHDTLLQSFHGLLMNLQTASRLLPGRPLEAKERLDGTIDQVEEAIVESRDAVQGLRASTVQSNDLARAISTLGEGLAADSTHLPAPAFRVTVEGASRELHPILRDEIYRIAAEALRNAFRHAQARQIEVEVRYDHQEFRLHVRDDGQGFDPAVFSSQGRVGHYGLPGMRERATLAGGRLTIWSKPNAGTEVELTIPAGTAYAASSRRSGKMAGKLRAQEASKDPRQ